MAGNYGSEVGLCWLFRGLYMPQLDDMVHRVRYGFGVAAFVTKKTPRD